MQQYGEPTSYLSSDLKLTNAAVEFLHTARKWSLFLSILGFIGIGFMALGGIGASIALSMVPSSAVFPFPPALFGLIYFAIAALYFVPVLYLYQFSSKMKRALYGKDEYMLESAFESLKSHYKYIGILMITLFALYVLIIIGVGITAAVLH